MLAWIAPSVVAWSQGLPAMSPMSATFAAAKGATPVARLTPRSIVEASRIARGPCRAPGRFVVPPSQGRPRMPTSTSPKRG